MAGETVECPNCGEVNLATRALCHACGRVLRPGGALEADWTPTPLADADSAPPTTGRRVLLTVVGLLLVALVVWGSYWLGTRRGRTGGEIGVSADQLQGDARQGLGQAVLPARSSVLVAEPGEGASPAPVKPARKAPPAAVPKPPQPAKPTEPPAAQEATPAKPAEPPDVEEHPDAEALAEALELAAQQEAEVLTELASREEISQMPAVGRSVPGRYVRRGPTAVELHDGANSIERTGSSRSPYEGRVTGTHSYLITDAFPTREEVEGAPFTRRVVTPVTWLFSWRNGAWVCTDMESGHSTIEQLD